MSKIICDVCGTSYPESANQCPICGCVRPVDPKVVFGSTENPETEAAGSYTYVKGGRFSKKNVKKRTRDHQPIEHGADTALPDVTESKTKKTDKGLVITVIALLLAIVAVLVYISVRFLIPGASTNTGNAGNAGTSATTTAPTSESTTLTVPCEKLTLSDVIVELSSSGAIQLLSVKAEPADTTDVMVFTSEDEAVATVNQDGKIEAVGPGQTVITIVCGDQTASCRVICTFEGETTTPSTEAPTNPVYDPSELKLLKSDVTLTKKGETWLCYKGKIPVEEITWTSDNEKVATVTGGKVVAVGKGNTKIHGEYGGKKVSCIIRCAPSVGVYVEPEETTAPTQSQNSYRLNTDNNTQKNDITLKVGESFTFRLLNADGEAVDAQFSCSNESVCSISGATVKGLALGTADFVAEYDGETHICIVRVSNS